MTTPRREFLSWLGAGGVVAAAGAHPGTPARSVALPRPVTDKWDMSWCDRVNGSVKAVFDSPYVSEGSALFRAQLWRDEHQEVYGTAPAQCSTVIVFRHEGIALAMNDGFWARFNMGKELKIKDEKGKKWTTINPVAARTPDTPEKYAAYNLASFLGSGGIVLACNIAFGRLVSRFKEADKVSQDEARKRALDHLIPGVILQPSGVFAALRAQQAGCAYLLAS